MNEFLKMDVFFFVTTLVVIVLAVLAGVALFYLIRILRNVEHVSERVAEESDNIQSDIAALRANVREQGLKMKHVSEFFATILKRNTRSSSSGKSRSDTSH